MNGLYIENGIVYEDRRFQKTSVTVSDGKIKSIGSPNTENLPTYDLKNNMLVPGFIDIHTHGGAGIDVNSADFQGLENISKFFASQGTTSWLASILTDTEEQTIYCIKQMNEYIKNQSNGATLLGIHLEGPFLSANYKGAMPENLLKNPNLSLLERYYNISEGNVKYLTISPELDDSDKLIEYAKNHNIKLAIGHSGADYETAMKFIEKGVSSSTHTFNAMKQLHHHEPSVIGAVLESDVFCEAICDGKHLHPGIVRILLKIKGYEKFVPVTDSIMAAGMPDGEYMLGVNKVIVKDRDARLLSNDSRAGSTLTMINALKNLIQFTNKPLENILPLLTENPANLLDISHKKGSITLNKDADFLVINNDFDVISTIVNGKITYTQDSKCK